MAGRRGETVEEFLERNRAAMPPSAEQIERVATIAGAAKRAAASAPDVRTVARHQSQCQALARAVAAARATQQERPHPPCNRSGWGHQPTGGYL